MQEGTFGTEPVAVKYIPMEWLNLHNKNDASDRVQEFDIMRRLHHPRCVLFYGISHDPENILLVQVCVCLFFSSTGLPKHFALKYGCPPHKHPLPVRFLGQEYCTGGDLRAAMTNHSQTVKAKAVDFMHHIADAIDYLHRQKLVHRDIKAENCLLVKGGRQR
jgi:serine/threonine protein kinase